MINYTLSSCLMKVLSAVCAFRVLFLSAPRFLCCESHKINNSVYCTPPRARAYNPDARGLAQFYTHCILSSAASRTSPLAPCSNIWPPSNDCLDCSSSCINFDGINLAEITLNCCAALVYIHRSVSQCERSECF
jgi:hypothetical protein